MHFNPAIMRGDTPGITSDDLGYRERFATNREYFIDPTNGIDSNNGRSRARPWRTVAYAYSYAQQNFDLGGRVITFRLIGNATTAVTLTVL